MQQMIRQTYYVILWVFIATAGLTIVGLAYTWFSPEPAQPNASVVPSTSGSPTVSAPGSTAAPSQTQRQLITQRKLPYLGTLVTALLVEAIAVVFVFVRTGLKYLPEVKVHKTESATFQFMTDLLTFGTSVTIVSNRLSLLTRSDLFREAVIRKARNGTEFEFITRIGIPTEIREPLQELGARFYVTDDATPPQARFTLVNADRAGGETLAIARGTHPSHEITVFDANSGPQIIAMAKDIVRKSKSILAHGR
jgi:hypothetical protein